MLKTLDHPFRPSIADPPPEAMRWFLSRALIYSTPHRLSSHRLTRRFPVSSSPFPRSCLNGLVCKKFFSKLQKVPNRICKATKRIKEQHTFFEPDKHSHIMWWKERMEMCKKPSAVQLVKRLMYSNLLGLDHSLKNGSLKEGTLNMEMLQFKARFPREVLLCRVGDFYEAVGFDACVLVEHAGLNPFGGLRSDSIPKAGCPVINLRQTLDDLTRCGYSVCIVEEVQGPAHARSRKGRFISGHAHPGSPYVFGLAGVDDDVDFPEPMPVVGISHSAKGYCMVSVLETMKTFSGEDGLTEEAVVTKLRTCRCHHLFLHASLKQNSSGTCRWGEFGEGGLLWSECSGKNFEWFDGDPVEGIFEKVKDIYGLDQEAKFRNVTISSEKRPRPLYLGTATQIGVIPTDGIPSLLKVLLPSNCVGLPATYMRDLLLNPPPYSVASSIQETCKLMGTVTCSLPEFTCISAPKLVKLLESKEVNHMEFCRIKHVVDEVLLMCNNTDLFPIFEALLDPTRASTGLKIAPKILVKECKFISQKIDEIICLDGERDHAINSCEFIPSEFFYDMESSWKGRVKIIHAEEAFEGVQTAAKELSNAIIEDFAPIISRLKTILSPFGGPKGEISYAREHGTVWFKGKRFVPTVWANTPGEVQIKQLRHATDSKGRKVGEEWFTTVKVEHALARYHESTAKAKAKVLEILRELSTELQSSTNILVFSSTLLVIAKALFYHVSEGWRRKWVFPKLVEFVESEDNLSANFGSKLELIDLSPYWFDVAQSCAIHNTIMMQSMFLLTGPNGGGKSSLLRSICAAALLGICGLMVPAESAVIPHFDAIMLHMKSYDSPADGKSSFQIEMSEIRSIITSASSRSLVLLDEICRGTETAKGTCIAGSVIEALDHVGCLGVISTHLHGIFDLPLALKKTVYKSMGTETCDDCIKTTWKLVDGVCRESLAFETARKEGVPEKIIRRAAELYCTTDMSNASSDKIGVMTEEPRFDSKSQLWNSISECEAFSEAYSDKKSLSGLLTSDTLRMEPAKLLHHEVEGIVTIVCQRKLIDLYKKKNIEDIAIVTCSFIGVREMPPPSTTGTSSVYILFRPDKKLYVGQTDDLIGRVCAHRSKEGLQNSSFLYVVVPGKSVASQLETILINQLPLHGYRLANKADGKHRNFGTSSLYDSFNNSVVDGLHSTRH